MVQIFKLRYKNNRLDKWLFYWGHVMEGIRTVFENTGKFVYIPDLKPEI